MYFINTVSALEMDEVQEIIHYQEIAAVLDCILQLPDYPCAVLAKFQDPMNESKPQEILACTLHSILEFADQFDSKNGIDLLVSDDKFLIMLVYGGVYAFENTYYYRTVALKVMPYDENECFINIMDDVLSSL